MNKFRLLKADEIECRIAKINDNGLSLLLYKTARTDANLLDETVGAENWENDFKVVDGVLYGGIGIYDPQMDRWVWKWDAGTESNTEAEKGRASDAFKRAGFKHGIGRELYTAPFVFISKDNCEIKKNERGKLVCFDDFVVKEIEYTNSEISRLVIANEKKGVDVFEYPRQTRKFAEPKNDKAKQAPDGYFYCEECGEIIKTVLTNEGAIQSSEIAERSMKKYGRQLCVKCAKNESKAS